MDNNLAYSQEVRLHDIAQWEDELVDAFRNKKDYKHMFLMQQMAAYALVSDGHINEALEKHLNFSMIQDAWVRVLDSPSDQEIVSFQMDEYYSNVTSMMIGEIYLYHGTWKFNAVGNGVARDLAGLCELYGVQTA